MPVLLVVGDDALRTKWAAQLGALGHRVTTVGSAGEGRRYLRAFTPLLVVFHAPNDDEDTRAFLHELSPPESGPRPPIVVISKTPGTIALAEDHGFTVLDVAVEPAKLLREIVRLAPESRRAHAR